MAKERVQVQGLGGAVPGISPTIQRGGQDSVQVQQAGRNKLMDLADALGQVNPMLQQYGQVQKIQFEKGAERGEMEAATADLDQAIEGLDATGEKLVEQGLMPRSQLVGYQRSYKRRIGQRQAKTLYVKSLNERIQEVTQDLESDTDIVSTIIAEERDKALQQLGQSPLAMQGFADFSDSVENSFYNNATKKRDRAVQDYNEGMIVEEFNQDFGEMLTAAESTPEDVAQLQLAMKSRMDAIAEEGKIPRSRVVELFWNGFAVPNIRGLLAGDNPQPEKAEKMLDSMLNIDLTGKGGKLGNINREGAAIRSGTATFRDQIAQAREKIESDVDDVAKRIVNEYTVASNDIQSGPSGNEELDNRAKREIIRQLQHAGYSEIEAGFIAEEVYSNSDVAGYTRYLSRFLDNDVTREAFGKAFRSFGSTRMQQLQLSSMYLTKRELPELIARFEEMAKTNPTLTSSEFLSSGGAGFKPGPIMDKEARARVAAKELELDKKKWWENSKAKQTTTSSFNNSLKTNTEALYMKQGELKASRAQIDQLMELGREADFKTRYETLIREAVDKIDPDDPNREELMLEEEKKISEQMQGRWKRLQETLKTVSDQERRRQASKGFDPTEFNNKLEQAERDLRDLEPFWAETIKESLFEVGKFAGVFEEVDDPSITIAERDYAFREMTGATSPMRVKALEAADKFDKALLDEPRMIADFEDPDAPASFKETSKLLRQRFGYSSIDQVPDFAPSTLLVDWRMTPIVAEVDDLRALGDAYINELTEYHKLPLQEKNIEGAEFSTLRKMRDKFGIVDGPTKPDADGRILPPNLMIFIASQRALFNK